MNEQRLLAIDFGKKRIGIAVTDPLNLFAYPLITILNDTNIWNNLSKIISEYNVVKLIIGYPLKENGDESVSSRGFGGGFGGFGGGFSGGGGASGSW